MRFVVLLALIGVIFACEKDEGDKASKIDLIFELKYDGELLSGLDELYALNDSVSMRFSKVSFYLSDFKLTQATQELPLLDVLHISFLQNIKGDAIQEMKQKLTFEVPSGDYSSISFGLGLTPAQNSTIPADHEARSALSLTSEYWQAWDSYIFEKIEGTYQVNGGNSESVALHVGGDETYRILEWRDGLSLSGDRNVEITIPIDLKTILTNFPVTESPKLHALEQLPLMEQVADGFYASMHN